MLEYAAGQYNDVVYFLPVGTASFTADDLLSVYSDIGMQYNIDTSLPDMGKCVYKSENHLPDFFFIFYCM